MSEKRVDILQLLCIANYRLYEATLIGNAPPFVAQMREAMRNPKLGDLVMEISTIWNRNDDSTRLGHLMAEREEVVPYEDEEAAELNNHEIIRDRFTYIKLLDGTTYKWSNCQFIRVFGDFGAGGKTSDEQR